MFTMFPSLYVFARRVHQQLYWKKVEPHYSLKFTLGLDESRLESKLRCYRLFENWQFSLDAVIGEEQQLKLKNSKFSKLFRKLKRKHSFFEKRIEKTSTRDVAIYALDYVMTSDTDKLNVASVKKLIYGIQTMKNLETLSDLLDITNKLSWLLPKLKDDRMKTELGRILVELLCRNTNNAYPLLLFAVELYDSERLELCIRNGLFSQNFTLFDNLWGSAFLMKNSQLLLNFGLPVVTEYGIFTGPWFQFFNIFTRFEYEEFVQHEENCVLSAKARKFWVLLSAHCYSRFMVLRDADYYQFIQASPNGYVGVEDEIYPQDCLHATRYIWRSILQPYVRDFEFFEALHKTSLPKIKIDALCEWYAQEISNDEGRQLVCPRSLLQHCRVAIRVQLLKKDYDLVNLIDQLDLPEHVKDYLKLKL